MAADIRMVVFDLGGVVVRICRSWAEACSRCGVPVHQVWDDADARRARHQLSHEYQLGRLGSEEFFARLARTVPGIYTPTEIERVHDAWLIDEYAGVASLIDDLHEAGVETGVLSNTNEAHWRRLAALPGGRAEFPTPSKVRHLHASHLLGAAKPDEPSFRAFETVTGARACPGGDILFFDDMEENIAGAATAGWRAHLVDHAGDTAAQMRDALRAHGIHLRA